MAFNYSNAIQNDFAPIGNSYVRFRCTGEDCPFCTDGSPSSSFTCLCHKETQYRYAKEVSALIRKYYPLYLIWKSIEELPAPKVTELTDEQKNHFDRIMEHMGRPDLKPFRGIVGFRVKISPNNEPVYVNRIETAFDYGCRLRFAFDELILQPKFKYDPIASKQDTAARPTSDDLVADLLQKLDSKVLTKPKNFYASDVKQSDSHLCSVQRNQAQTTYGCEFNNPDEEYGSIDFDNWISPF